MCKWSSYRSNLFLQRTWRNYNLYHFFCDTPYHLLFFGLQYHDIFSTKRSILSLNINTISSQLLGPTYYKRAIIEQTLTIFNKTFLNFQSLHSNVFFYFLNVFYFVYNVKPLQRGLLQNKTFSFKKSVVIFGEV